MLHFITAFLVGLAFSSGDSPGAYRIDMVKDILRNFHTNWIILQAWKRTDQSIINLSKEITDSMNIYASVLECEDFRLRYEGFDNFRPLVLLTAWSSQDCLSMINTITNDKAMERFVWVALTLDGQSNTSMLDVPISSLFLLVEETNPGSHTLTEIYTASSPSEQTFREVGTWSPEQGLVYTDVSFEKRRSDFQGRNFITVVEPENSTNRLYNMYRQFFPSYLDLAKRLNFRVEPVTDPGERFEVSVVLHYMDVDAEPGMCHLPPLSSSWNSIFFHDVGVKMKFESYVKPLSSTVWLAMGLVIILAGFTSYGISHVLNRLEKRNVFPLRIDIYIYRSLYIFLQKSECSDLFTAHRIVTITQWMISICLMGYYSANLTSFVSVTIPKAPFSSLDDLLAQKTHNIVSAKYISAGKMDHIKTSKDARLRKLYENNFDPERNLQEDPVRFFCDEENYLMVTSESYVEKIRGDPNYKGCQISNTRIRLSKRHFTWTVDKSSHYERFFRFYLSRLDSAGALHEYVMKHLIHKRDPEPVAFRGMTFEDTLILFIVFTAGVMLSVIILLSELSYKLLLKRRFQQNFNRTGFHDAPPVTQFPSEKF